MAESSQKMPAGIGNAYAFQVLNTVSFAIVLGTPMILYFKHLEAAATVLGIVAALPNLLNILQIPAAQFVEQVGYRAFVLRGWSVRSALILAMAVIPLLSLKLDHTTRIALMLFLLFVYSASRGVSLCGFLPWVTHLVPERVRGRYVSGDQMSAMVATLAATLATAFYLGDRGSSLAYALLLFASAFAAIGSVAFLVRIPDVPVTPQQTPDGALTWKTMLAHVPFRRLMLYNVVINAALGAAGVFWVPLLRDLYQAGDKQVLEISAVCSAVSVVSLLVVGREIDRVGSRPLLALAGFCLIVHFASWGSLAAHLLPFRVWTFLWIQGTAGVGVAMFNLANTRLAMATVPETGRSHFFALYTVINSLTLGIVPVIWGILLDSLQGWRADWGPWQWNQYTVFYAALCLTIVVGQFFLHHLSEARAMTTEAFFNELFVKTPSRVLSRLLSRRPFS
jgi:MFS family permease